MGSLKLCGCPLSIYTLPPYSNPSHPYIKRLPPSFPFNQFVVSGHFSPFLCDKRIKTLPVTSTGLSHFSVSEDLPRMDVKASYRCSISPIQGGDRGEDHMDLRRGPWTVDYQPRNLSEWHFCCLSHLRPVRCLRPLFMKMLMLTNYWRI